MISCLSGDTLLDSMHKLDWSRWKHKKKDTSEDAFIDPRYTAIAWMYIQLITLVLKKIVLHQKRLRGE